MLLQIEQWIRANFFLLWSLAALGSVLRFSYLFWRRTFSPPLFPDRNDLVVTFEEWWTSGVSYKSVWTRMCGASNCLWVMVTQDEVWIAPHLPFIVLADDCDLEHRIPKASVRHVERRGRRGVRVTYLRLDGKERKIELYLRSADRFVAALNLEQS